MARIPGKRKTRTVTATTPRRIVPTWTPLAVALVGVGLILGVGLDLPLWAPFAGTIILGIGAYWLGRSHGEAAPDPAARGRVSQLERALLQFAVLLGNDGLAANDQRRSEEPQPSQPREPAGQPVEAGRADHDGSTIAGAAAFDDPLPGEAR